MLVVWVVTDENKDSYDACLISSHPNWGGCPPAHSQRGMHVEEGSLQPGG
jgi:hypothetical protein